MTVHIKQVRGGQRGLQREAILIYQPGERKVTPTLLPPVSVALDVSTWEAQPGTDSQTWEAQMTYWSGETASEMLNSVGIAKCIASEIEATKTGECELGSWADCHPGDPWSSPQSQTSVGSTHTTEFLEKCAMRPATVFFI